MQLARDYAWCRHSPVLVAVADVAGAPTLYESLQSVVSPNVSRMAIPGVSDHRVHACAQQYGESLTEAPGAADPPMAFDVSLTSKGDVDVTV